jgi:amino acid permease
VAATLGAGTLTFAYAIKENGIVWGSILIILGAAISYYTGMLLVIASTKTNRHRYEDIALVLYGLKFARFTSIMNLLCLMAFIMSYIVYIKEAVIKIILIFAPDLNSFIVDKFWGQKFWGTLFSVRSHPFSLPIVLRTIPDVSATLYQCVEVFISFWGSMLSLPMYRCHYNILGEPKPGS